MEIGGEMGQGAAVHGISRVRGLRGAFPWGTGNRGKTEATKGDCPSEGVNLPQGIQPKNLPLGNLKSPWGELT